MTLRRSPTKARHSVYSTPAAMAFKQYKLSASLTGHEDDVRLCPAPDTAVCLANDADRDGLGASSRLPNGRYGRFKLSRYHCAIVEAKE